jgi:DNA or RNA helicases of superfamily II
MKIIIDSMIYVEKPDQKLLSWCNNNLIIANPLYIKMKNMGRSPWSIPQNIVFYVWHSGKLILPRGLLKTIWDMYPDIKLYTHRMNKCSHIEFNSDIKLRDYQLPAIDAIKVNKQGIIVMPCGAGKTETALQIAVELKQPTLWITHTTDLLNQSLSRAREKLHLTKGEYGTIGAGDYTIGSHITFATVQSLKQKDLDSIKHRFGTVIVDECHRAFISDSKMGMFQHVIEHLPSLYRIGITASEHRSDGLIKGMFHMLGDKIYEVNQDDLNRNGNVIAPEVVAVPTNYKYEGDATLEFGAMLADMIRHDDRNEIILNKIRDNKHFKCLVLSDRLEQLNRLYSYTSHHTLTLEYINGKTNRKQREAAIRKMQSGESTILFATYSLAKEGLDIPGLERLFLCTPHRDKVAVQQSVGRIMRVHEGKAKPRVYDFVDIQEGLCMSQYRSRKSVYKKLGCVIKEDNLKEYSLNMKGI